LLIGYKNIVCQTTVIVAKAWDIQAKARNIVWNAAKSLVFITNILFIDAFGWETLGTDGQIAKMTQSITTALW
jgi:hypothetical protein